MNRLRWIALLGVMLTIIAAPTLWAADKAREQLLNDSLKQLTQVGQVIDLKSSSGDFIGIHTEATPDLRHKGAVLILHDMSNNPNSDGLIHPVRTGLPGHGWSTLAIQLPLATDGASPDDYWPLIADSTARIDAAITWLKSTEAPSIVLLGHGLGGIMATHYLSKKQNNPDVQAVVTIGLPVPQTDLPEAQTLAHIETLRLPTLDLYGSQDLREVVETAAQRRQAAKKSKNPNYRQTEWMGADHDFSGLQDSLIPQINGWLSHHIRKP